MRRALPLLLLGLLVLPAWKGEELAFTALDGAAVALRPEPGQLLVVHFWSTWCPDCRRELRGLQDAAAGCPEERVRVVAVNVGESRTTVDDFVRAHDLALPVLRDADSRVFRQLGARGLPLNLYWSDAARRTEVGPRRVEQWRTALSALGCNGTDGRSTPADR